MERSFDRVINEEASDRKETSHLNAPRVNPEERVDPKVEENRQVDPATEAMTRMGLTKVMTRTNPLSTATIQDDSTSSIRRT